MRSPWSTWTPDELPDTEPAEVLWTWVELALLELRRCHVGIAAPDSCIATGRAPRSGMVIMLSRGIGPGLKHEYRALVWTDPARPLPAAVIVGHDTCTGALDHAARLVSYLGG